MSLSADLRKEKGVIVVEGYDDILFFKNMKSEATYIYESFSGKLGVREIIEFFNDIRIIGICDMDYDTTYKNDLIFHYDYSCLETMMLSCDAVLKCIVSQLYFGDLTPEDLRLEVLKNLQLISLLRKYNYLNNGGICFNGLSIHKAFDNKKVCLDFEKVLMQLASINKDFSVMYNSGLLFIKEKFSERATLDELLSLTNGHDFVSCFHCFCLSSKKRRSPDQGVDTLAICLRCAYRASDFRTTRLYSIIIEHQHACGITFIAS